jgi:hypothetical protein
MAWAQGIEQVVPRRYLVLFTPTELAQRVCGTATVDVAELKRTATYSGLSPLEPSVRYFWEVLEAFTPAQVRLPFCHRLLSDISLSLVFGTSMGWTPVASQGVSSGAAEI